MIMTMKARRTIAAGKFKAECLALLDEVEETRQPLVVTKRGRPVAKIVPMDNDEPISMLGSVKYHGDIVEAIGEPWDADS